MLSVLAISGGALAASAASADAAAPPLWQPESASLGTLTFYDASGNVVTSGNNLGHLFAYAKASTADAASGLKATLEFAIPEHASAAFPDPGTWPVAADTGEAATSQPAAGLPAPISNATPVVNTNNASGGDVGTFISSQSFDPTAGYNDMVEVRVVTAGGGGGSNAAGQWWETDISVNPAAGTWTQAFPAVLTSTNTNLVDTPNPWFAGGGAVSMQATVTPAGTAGSVDFTDVTTASDFGNGAYNAATGVATLSHTFAAATAGDTIKATFTPADPTSFNGSNGTTVQVVNPGPDAPTTTTLTVTQDGTAGHDVSLSSTVSPAAAAGSVSFYDNGSATPLNPTPIPWTGGPTVTFDIPAGLAAGGHSIVAKFTPTNPANFQTSQSTPQLFQLDPVPPINFVQAGTPSAPLSGGVAGVCDRRSSDDTECWGTFNPPVIAASSTPARVGGVTGATAISTSQGSSCALLANGQVRCWGDNTFGQLGDGSETSRDAPAAVAGISAAVAITVKNNHDCAVLDDHSLVCWGANNDGQLGDGSTDGSPLPIDVDGSGYSAVDGGTYFTCAVKLDASVSCWGDNSLGQLGDGQSAPSAIPATVPGLPAVRAIAGKYAHMCAVTQSGDVWCWGDNNAGLIDPSTPGIPVRAPEQITGIQSAVQVSTGQNHACVLLSDGHVECWGDNSFGQLGNGSTTPSASPTVVEGLTGVLAIAATSNSTCAQRLDGSVYCWGEGNAGQLGDGQTDTSSIPVVALPGLGPCAQLGSQCAETQTIQTEVPVGTLIINTPYTATNPLDLGPMTLNGTGTEFNVSGGFKCITIADTTAGALPWTAQALASNLVDQTPPSGATVTQISAQNVGLTGFTRPVAPADAPTCSDTQSYTGTVATADNAAAEPAVAPAAPGTAGLGGTTSHTFATGTGGDGVTTLDGTLTINAPANTAAGTYRGTITFTVAD
jgi:hypothetical protein